MLLPWGEEDIRIRDRVSGEGDRIPGIRDRWCGEYSSSSPSSILFLFLLLLLLLLGLEFLLKGCRGRESDWDSESGRRCGEERRCPIRDGEITELLIVEMLREILGRGLEIHLHESVCTVADVFRFLQRLLRTDGQDGMNGKERWMNGWINV